MDRRVLPSFPLRIAESVASFFVFFCAVFFSLKEHNPLLVNPINIVSQRLTPVLRESLSNYPRFSKLFMAEKILPAAEPTPVAPSLSISPSGAETTVATLTPLPTVFVRNPKHSGGDQAVYELLRNKSGAVSGPSSLGAKLVVRENYNLFPVHWRESQFVATDLSGYPKTFGSVSGVLGGTVSITGTDFLRKSLREIAADPRYGVIYSGDGLVVFEQGASQTLFEVLPVGQWEGKKPIGSSREAVLNDFVFPENLRRNEAVTCEIAWSFEGEEPLPELLEGMPFLALVPEGSQVASFYDAVYGLFISLEKKNTPIQQRFRQEITVPERLSSGEYKIYFGWYELINWEMAGHAKLKDAVELGSVKIE